MPSIGSVIHEIGFEIREILRKPNKFGIYMGKHPVLIYIAFIISDVDYGYWHSLYSSVYISPRISLILLSVIPDATE